MYNKIIFIVFLSASLLYGCGEDRDQDTTPPTIKSVSPPNSATGVAVNSNLKVAFSETMDSSSITDTSFYVRTGGIDINGSIVPFGTFATFKPLTSLQPFKGYTATVTTGIKDSNRNHLIFTPSASSYSWGFITGSSTSESSISFASNIQTIFDNNCTGCHHSGELLPSFLPLTDDVSYSNLVNKASAYTPGGTLVIPNNYTGSILYKRVSGNSIGGRMPKDGTSLGSTDIGYIKTWIDEGALDN